MHYPSTCPRAKVPVLRAWPGCGASWAWGGNGPTGNRSPPVRSPLGELHPVPKPCLQRLSAFLADAVAVELQRGQAGETARQGQGTAVPERSREVSCDSPRQAANAWTPASPMPLLQSVVHGHPPVLAPGPGPAPCYRPPTAPSAGTGHDRLACPTGPWRRRHQPASRPDRPLAGEAALPGKARRRPAAGPGQKRPTWGDREAEGKGP
jgi:hypothetical protein